MKANGSKIKRFEAFRKLSGEEELNAFRERMEREGFTGFRHFLDEFKEAIRSFEDDGSVEMAALVEQGKRLFPKPGLFSPSWQNVWEEYSQTVAYKAEVLARISPSSRDGEWQVLMDNPFTNEGLVCYPALSFLEASYLYAYFRSDLKKNEYIRLQKIQDMLMAYGGEQQG